MSVMLRASPELPDALIGRSPKLGDRSSEPGHHLPSLEIDRIQKINEAIKGADHLSIDVELKLHGSLVADPHGLRAAISGKPVRDRLRGLGFAVNGVQDLKPRP